MAHNRISQLKGFLAEDPSDPFPRYALALEYLAIGDAEIAENYFLELETHYPDYLPAYYQFAQYLIHAGRESEARKLISKGMHLARERKDMKTLRELNELLEESIE